MNEPIEYIIVGSDVADFTRFTKNVSRKLQDGYELYGGPFVVNGLVHQAMVKHNHPQKAEKVTPVTI